MPVPRSNPTFRLLAGLFLVAAVALPRLASPASPRSNNQPLRLPLDAFGYQPLSTEFLLAGGSMLTLHYVDDTHLLLTFTVHRLMPRLSDEPDDDQDRTVDAVLLELPSGHILARTSWRLHDRGQYLWSLGHGRFLLRIRDTLTAIAPLDNLSTPEPFRQTPFLRTDGRRIAALMVSPGADMMMVETMRRNPARAHSTANGMNLPASVPDISGDSSPVQINFYRIAPPTEAIPQVHPRSAGVVRSASTGNIASNSSGYLAILDQGHQQWAFDFNTWTGKNMQLSPFDSTCRPSPWLVSRGEFIAFGCHLGGREIIGGFNMKGDEMWEQGLDGSSVAPSFDFAPNTGRFALSRILLSSSAVADQPLTSDQISSQSITVFQTGTGRQLLRAQCSPVERAGQNFSIAPDGLALAVVHADSIEVWPLPAPDAKDQDDVKQALASAPEANDAPVRFGTGQKAVAEAESATQPPVPESAAALPADGTVVIVGSDSGSPTAESNTASAAPAAPEDPATKVVSVAAEGDPAPDAPRKRPTLYTLPSDPPQRNSSDEQH